MARNIYEVIYADLREQIESGALSANERLPSEPELAQQYGVSRMTVRHAMDRLVNDQMIVRRRGSGTYIAEQRPRFRRVNRLGSLQVEMGRSEADVRTTVLVQQAEQPPAEVRRALGLSPRQRAIHLLRVRFVDDSPAAVQDSWLPHDVAPGLARTGLVGGSLYRTLAEAFHIELDWAEQRVSAVAARGEWAKWLDVADGVPLIEITRWTYSKEQALIEYATSWTRSDFPLFIRLES